METGSMRTPAAAFSLLFLGACSSPPLDSGKACEPVVLALLSSFPAELVIDGQSPPIRPPARIALTPGTHELAISQRPAEQLVESEEPPRDQPLALTAHQVFKAHRANALRYQGKTLRVTGNVGNISQGTWGGVTVYLKVPRHGQVSARLGDGFDVDTFASVNPGDEITLDCVGGKPMLDIPSLDDCTLAR